MAKVRTLSRFYMKGHPKAGEPTFFVEKFLNSMNLPYPSEYFWTFVAGTGNEEIFNTELLKGHTIRMGRHFMPVDELTLAVWSGVPYRSKQIKLWTGDIRAVDIEIVVLAKDYISFIEADKDTPPIDVFKLATNDGLSPQDFIDWFKLPIGIHEAQILIWNKDINY